MGNINEYFPRRLLNTDAEGVTRTLDERAFLAISGPKIVLGEPGMGKSELIREIGRRLCIESVTALRFMNSEDPARFVAVGKPLLIDGLDEAMARRDGDAVDKVLAQLEAAGSPDFILSCRAREWQARTGTGLHQLYRTHPGLFTLQALSRVEAHAFLRQRYAKANAEHVLTHLAEHGISDLYSNPLTLGLMGRVAEHDTQLPGTRAALFERVCTLIWPEHDSDRQDIGLGKITEDQALSAAGAIMAGLLLSGSDSVTLAGPAQLMDGDVRLVDLEVLPGASAARVVFSSKLFQTSGAGRAKPIHRVIAEFLGARWLASHATTTRRQRRLLTQLHSSGGVPASLRGLHAWLAFHSVTMARDVISADPFGVLRYGEGSNLTAEHANYMFDALQALAEADPYFRAQDWSRHPAAGLMIPSLRTKIDTVIASSRSNSHLRSLLIEGIKGSQLANDLSDTLESVMFSPERFYSEREDAAEALLPSRGRTWWQGAVATLHDQGDEDSTRLARSIIELVQCDISDDLLVGTLLAEMGLTICPLPRVKKARTHTIFHYESIVESCPATRLINVLNLFSEYAVLLRDRNWQSNHDLQAITSLLIVRAIDKQVVTAENAELLWSWLRVVRDAGSTYGVELSLLQTRLNDHDILRQAVQYHVLYKARPRPTIWGSQSDLARRMVGLEGRSKDIACLLKHLAGSDNTDPKLRADWCDLMQLAVRYDGLDADVRSASRAFQADDAQLEAFAWRLENPKKSAWQIKEERQAAKRNKKQRISREMDRRIYAANRRTLRAGELKDILNPAMAYLGLFRDSKKELPATERIVEWLGPELASDATVGLEAVLHRGDLPSPEDVARGLAEGTRWNYGFAIIAGLLVRLRANVGFDDVPIRVRMTGLIECLTDSIRCVDDDLQKLGNALELSAISTTSDRESFVRLLIEPSIEAGALHIPGLNRLVHDEKWRAAVAVLAQEWLIRFSNLPGQIELKLVDCLVYTGALKPLALVAAERSRVIFCNEDQLFSWLAIDMLVRFREVVPDISGIGAEYPDFIWFLRDRFQVDRRYTTLAISVAQVEWIVSEFRGHWPHSYREGGGGDRSSFEATSFLSDLLSRISNDTSSEASEAMQRVVAEPSDSYTDLFRHMAAEQRQKCTEKSFAPLLPKNLAELLDEGPPSNADDLKSLVLEELMVAQKILIGDDLDQVRNFWSDEGIPRDENRCRDCLAAIIGPCLARYDVQRITEADMPKSKRADLAFSRGQIQLPMEVKGQWHKDVWKAATDQLDLQYLIDWRSAGRGIYCVLWFGNMPSKSGRRLQNPPVEIKKPRSAEEMRELLISCIPEPRRTLIDVVVLDLTAGKPSVG